MVDEHPLGVAWVYVAFKKLSPLTFNSHYCPCFNNNIQQGKIHLNKHLSQLDFESLLIYDWQS